MSNTSITYLVAAFSGGLRPGGLHRVHPRPGWTSYSRVWERCAAAFLTLYVVAACLGLGLAGGGAIVWFWDRIQG